MRPKGSVWHASPEKTAPGRSEAPALALKVTRSMTVDIFHRGKRYTSPRQASSRYARSWARQGSKDLQPLAFKDRSTPRSARPVHVTAVVCGGCSHLTRRAGDDRKCY